MERVESMEPAPYWDREQNDNMLLFFIRGKNHVVVLHYPINGRDIRHIPTAKAKSVTTIIQTSFSFRVHRVVTEVTHNPQN
jgi:hypothetical protein